MFNNLLSRIEKIIYRIVIWIAIPVILLLTIQAFFVKVRITIWEHSGFYPQDWWQYILVLAGFLGVLFLVKKIWRQKKIPIPVLLCVTLLYVAAMIAIVLSMRVVPRADQQVVLQLADQFANGDYSAWNKGNYCDMYTNQDGLILVFSLLSRLWGANNWMAFQIVNIFLIVLAAWGMKQIVQLLFSDKTLASISYLCLILYMPMNGYVTFVYGTLPGLTCAVWGSYFILVSCRTESVRPAIWGASLLAFACVLKNNYWIILIGAAIVAFCYFVRKRKAKLLLPLLLIVLISLVLNGVLAWYMNTTTGSSSERGIPSAAWVAMGLQEEGTKAPGWYNGYTKEVYKENGFDSKKAKIQAKRSIMKSLSHLFSDKRAGILFFGQKIASEWNEATFQSVWINQLREHTGTMPRWIEDLLDNSSILHRVYVRFCDFLLIIIWVGFLLFLWKRRKDSDIGFLLWVIVFLGGFIFHLFWEAKGQYTLIYVWLCIPYAIHGYQLCLREIAGIRTSRYVEKGNDNL